MLQRIQTSYDLIFPRVVNTEGTDDLSPYRSL